MDIPITGELARELVIDKAVVIEYLKHSPEGNTEEGILIDRGKDTDNEYRYALYETFTFGLDQDSVSFSLAVQYKGLTKHQVLKKARISFYGIYYID